MRPANLRLCGPPGQGARTGFRHHGDRRHCLARDRRVLCLRGLCGDAGRADIVFRRPRHCRHRPQEADGRRDGANHLAAVRGHADPGRGRDADAAAGAGGVAVRGVDPGAGGLLVFHRPALFRQGRPARPPRPPAVDQCLRHLRRRDLVRAVGRLQGPAAVLAGRALAAAGGRRRSARRARGSRSAAGGKADVLGRGIAVRIGRRR